MKIFKSDIISLILFSIGITGLIILLSGCAVHKVNKSEKKQLKVISNYLKNHPVKNDTSYIYTPGDTITKTEEHFDTSYRFAEGETDTIFKPVYITKTVTVTKTVKDTIVKKIVDRSFQVELQKELSTTYQMLQENKVTISELKRKLDIWRIRFFVLLSINTLIIAWRIRNLFI